MQWWILILLSNDLTNYGSILTHSYFDTNITQAPYYKANPIGQVVIDIPSTYCQFYNASFRAFPNTKS